MSNFEQMISIHKRMINNDFQNIINYLNEKAISHDDDKILPGEVNDTYVQHFPKLKQIEFGTKEYLDYEQRYFKTAHNLHAQNRHHYYSPLNDMQDVDLFDVLEAMVDIRQSQRQYAGYDINCIMNTFKQKGVLDFDLEKVVFNTLKRLESFDE